MTRGRLREGTRVGRTALRVGGRERWRLEGASDHGVNEALYLSDPAGNGVEIYRDFPESAWPSGPDGSVRMGTERLDLDAVEAAATGAIGHRPGPISDTSTSK